ncbi:hypothetical protein, partial [Pelagicoccus sp. SDUM812002]|uniref:hypothetical protein n=1 Tax=Pelagicoccus sp. SDUM812002 TaxID=3041266 RepID=UPI00280ED54D
MFRIPAVRFPPPMRYLWRGIPAGREFGPESVVSVRAFAPSETSSNLRRTGNPSATTPGSLHGTTMPSADSSRSTTALPQRTRRFRGASKPSSLVHEASPDKDVDFRHANASFTLCLEPGTGFASLGTLARDTEPSMTCCSLRCRHYI